MIPQFKPGSILSICGAGGKTSLMFWLARNLPAPCVTTTTAKVGTQQLRDADLCITLDDFLEEPPDVKCCWVADTLEWREPKNRGVTLRNFSFLAKTCGRLGITVINEADGAACRHIKAPAEHEPPIPPESTAVLCVIGLDVIGQFFTGFSVHRPEYFAAVTGLPFGGRISADTIINLIRHSEGAFKNTPANAEKIIVLNQADTAERVALAKEIAQAVLPKDTNHVWITSLKEKGILEIL